MTAPHRRTILGALIAGALVLTGCSGTTEPDQDGDENAATAPADGEPGGLPPAEGQTSYPLSLPTPFGETVLAERPERIAIIGGNGELEAALALEVIPVIAPWSGQDWAWLPAAGGDQIPETIDPWSADGLAFERLLAAEPDLIIALTYGTLADDYERLAEIAPVLAPAEQTDAPWAQEWTDLTRAVGAALDLGGKAEEVIIATDQYVADAAGAHPQFADRTVSIVVNRGEEIELELANFAGSPVEALLTDLGFAGHPNADELASEAGGFSLENLALIEADGLVLANHGGRGTAEEAQTWLADSALYQELDVVQREAVATVEPSADGSLDIAWAFIYPNALAIPWTVDQLNLAFQDIFEP